MAWLPGDGIGSEVLAAAKLVLDRVDFGADYIPGDIGWESQTRCSHMQKVPHQGLGIALVFADSRQVPITQPLHSLGNGITVFAGAEP